jgi:hypothetical protein
MWEWIASLAAIVQALFAGLLLRITRDYVRLTRELVAAQIEPGVLLEQSDQSSGIGTSESVSVRNLGKNEIVNVADSEGWRSAFRTDVDHDSEVMPISVPN